MRAFGVLLGAGVSPPVDYSAVDALFPERVAGFDIRKRSADGAAYMRADGLAVICSIATEQDGRRWLHVSYSRRARLPSYQDGCDVKAAFVGDEREAYSVWPRRSKHVNIHRFCLHLWCCIDADAGVVLPDFTGGGSSI